MLSVGAGSAQGLVLADGYALFHMLLEPLHLQDASSNFLVLRIKAHTTIGVSYALGSSQLWKRGPDKVAFVLLIITHSSVFQNVV